MSKVKPRFAPGDKVFAKVRGYPPWPARIEGLADETPNKMRYHVYFYGTGETAVIKAEDVFSFVENKVKFGKPKKQKLFTEALLQIEAELSPEDVKKANELIEKQNTSKTVTPDKAADLDISTNNAGDTPKTSAPRRLSTSTKTPKQPSVLPIVQSETSHSPETQQLPQQTPKPATPPPSVIPATNNAKPKEIKKRKAEELPDESESKKLKTSVSMLDDNKISPEVMSRSGRKIKPKRFADFEAGSDDEGTKPSNISSKDNIDEADDKEIDQEDEEEDQDTEEYIVALTGEGERVRIPLNLNKPEFSSVKNAEIWDNMVLRFANSLKKRIERGELISDIDDLMSEWTAMKSFDFAKERAPEEDKQQYEFLQTETKLLDIDVNLRSSLNLERANIDRCLMVLEQLNNLQITPLMLKKHPEVVLTIKRMRKYVGNISSWNLKKEELALFNRHAARIRAKSEHIYNKFKNLFLNQDMDNFWDFFNKEVNIFREKTKSFSLQQLYAIIEEPE